MSPTPLPTPAPGPGEALVRVTASVALPLARAVARDRLAHGRKARKLLFFLLREGPALTARKIRAQWLQARIQEARRVVVAVGRRMGDDAWVAAVGPQPDAGLDFMAFPEEGVRAAKDETEARVLRARCVAWLLQHPDVLRAAHVHSPWSGRAFPVPAAAWAPTSSSPETTGEAVVPRAPTRTTRPAVGARQGRGRGAYDLFLSGAGSYPCAYALPHLTGRRAMLMDLNPRTAAEVGARYGFGSCTTSLERLCEAIAQSAAPALVVAGYHDSHVPVAEAALAANAATKVCLEKPPVTTRLQLARLAELRADSRHFVEIGYNRRHTPWMTELKARLVGRTGPVAVTCSVREIRLPPWHWYLWPTQGTRVTGNLCHWLDLGVHLVGAPHTKVRVEAYPVPGAPDMAEAHLVEVAFADGSTLTVTATDQGDGSRGVEESIAARWDDTYVILDDFLRWTERAERRVHVRRSVRRDKGHAAMYRDFERRVRAPESRPFYPDEDLEPSCRLMLEAAEATQAALGSSSPRLPEDPPSLS